MSLEEDFQKASKDVLNLSSKPNNDTLLSLYALFKQGSTGDVSGSKPGMLDIKGRKKFEAWGKLKGMKSDEAKQKYVSLVADLASKN